MITPKTMDKFQYLIAPEVYADMEAGLPVTAIGLADDKTPVGAVAGVMENEHVFSVRSLYVAPDHRRQGGATMLISALERLLDTRDAEDVAWDDPIPVEKMLPNRYRIRLSHISAGGPG